LFFYQTETAVIPVSSASMLTEVSLPQQPSPAGEGGPLKTLSGG